MLLNIKDIHTSFSVKNGLLKKQKKKILKGVSFSVNKGECVGIIGESGSGKSTLARIILGIEKADSGSIYFDNSNKRKDWQGEISVVFQDYTTSVNPRFRVLNIIAEPLLNKKTKEIDIKQYIITLLKQVGLGEEFLMRYPHELSGGQLQRVCIARAIATKPRFIILDEAISSLDVSVQVQILDLLIDLKSKYNLSYLFITHDLTAVTYICDKVLFFKDGQVVEEVDSIKNLKCVGNDYSRKLLNSVLNLDLLCSS